MGRIGLALSGGGFRATLYHLGLIRFLRDAGVLPQVSHITSVSGGSIIAAHLVLNWTRYTGSEQDFDDVTKELLDFVRLDVRNRVVRRYPLAVLANGLRWLARFGTSRQLTRPGLLEAHYEKFLFGDRCLYELPAVPQLYILATNVNEGCLCSFTRSGLLVQRRMPDGTRRFEPIPSALATIPMAVTASSAFPGFFPPLQLTATDVGADESRFPPHFFTDGGVYDNLGVRMFRWIQESWIGHDSPLRVDDFHDLDAALEAIQAATATAEPTPLSRLAELVQSRHSEKGRPRLSAESLPTALWNVIVRDQLYRHPAFEQLELDDQQAADLKRLDARGRRLDQGDHLWLNRFLVNAAFQQTTGNALLRANRTEFQAVIVSDAGKQFTVARRTKGSGLLGTAMRATDILMDRVWQLENGQFGTEPGFVFAPMSLTVHLADDPETLHPEIQKQVTSTRTDLDRFSELEISGLVRHGYAVMRKVCRSRPDLFGKQLPDGPPWDPVAWRPNTTTSPRAASETTVHARDLQASAQRQILGRLFDLRDWPTYVFVPLILFLVIGVPSFAYTRYQIARRSSMIVDAITLSNPDFQLVLQLARQNAVPGQWKTLAAEEVTESPASNVTEFELVTDTRVLDMRAWKRGADDPEHPIISYRRLLVRRIADGPTEEKPTDGSGILRLQQFTSIHDVSFRCDAESLHPVFRLAPHTLPNGKQGYLAEFELDLSSVPAGQDFAVGFETMITTVEAETGDERVVFPIIAKTDVASLWVLLPPGEPCHHFDLIVYDPATPSKVRSLKPTYDFQMADGSLFGWMIVAPQDKHIYECTWFSRADATGR